MVGLLTPTLSSVAKRKCVIDSLSNKLHITLCGCAEGSFFSCIFGLCLCRAHQQTLALRLFAAQPVQVWARRGLGTGSSRLPWQLLVPQW